MEIKENLLSKAHIIFYVSFISMSLLENFIYNIIKIQ